MWQHIGTNIHYNGDYRIIKRRNGWLIKENFNEVGFEKTLPKAKERVEKMLSTKMYHNNPEIAIWGKYKGNIEKIDKAYSQREADRLAGEYRMAFGRDWIIWTGRKSDFVSNPYSVRKLPYSNKYRVRGEGGRIHAFGTTRRKADAQVRLLNQIESNPMNTYSERNVQKYSDIHNSKMWEEGYDDGYAGKEKKYSNTNYLYGYDEGHKDRITEVKSNPDANAEVVRKFVAGKDYANSGSLHIDSLRPKTTVLKTYTTPLAIRNMENDIPVYYVNKSKYSRTSSRHYTILMSALIGEKINLLDEDGLREIISKLMRGV